MTDLKIMHKLKITLLISLLLPTNIANARSNLTDSGEVLQIAIPLASLGVAVYKQDTEGQKEFLKSFVVNTVLTHATKFALKNSELGKRPNGRKYSFPSGHAASAFQGAFFLHKRYGIQYGAPAIALAGFTGYTRVRGKYHYWRDVVGGAAIAFGVNYFLVSPYEQKNLQILTDVGLKHVILGAKLDF